MSAKYLNYSSTLAAATFCLIAAAGVAPISAAQPAPDANLPHLEKRGAVTQLIVDGKPFIILGGQVGNPNRFSRPDGARVAQVQVAQREHD